MKCLQNAQQTQTKTHNNKINLKHFKMKDQMMLFTKNLKNAKFKKTIL